MGNPSCRVRCGWSVALAITTNAREAWSQLKNNTSSVPWSFGRVVPMEPMRTPRTTLGYGPSCNSQMKQPYTVASYSSYAGSIVNLGRKTAPFPATKNRLPRTIPLPLELFSRKDLPRSLRGRVLFTTADALKKAFTRDLERVRRNI